MNDHEDVHTGAGPARAGVVREVEIGAGAFKDRCLQLFDRVADREIEIVVTKYGKPVARVVAPTDQVPSAFGFLSGTVIAEGDIVSPDFEAWGGVE